MPRVVPLAVQLPNDHKSKDLSPMTAGLDMRPRQEALQFIVI